MKENFEGLKPFHQNNEAKAEEGDLKEIEKETDRLTEVYKKAIKNLEPQEILEFIKKESKNNDGPRDPHEKLNLLWCIVHEEIDINVKNAVLEILKNDPSNEDLLELFNGIEASYEMMDQDDVERQKRWDRDSLYIDNL